MTKVHISGVVEAKQVGHPDQGLPGHPDQGLPGGPVGIWGPTDPRPNPPIYIPITPPPESGLSPEHPIYIPVYPDNSLPGDQPYPDQGLPGDQPRPDNSLPPYLDNTLPDGGKAEIMKKLKEAVDFWTGNLPISPKPVPTPTKKK